MRINLPTALTLGRVAVIPIVVGLFYIDWQHARQATAILFVVAAVTDWFDGWLARRWNQTSNFGAFLDPVADKLLVPLQAVALVYVGLMYWRDAQSAGVLWALGESACPLDELARVSAWMADGRFRLRKPTLSSMRVRTSVTGVSAPAR